MKRQMLMFVCTLVFAICCAVGLVACGGDDGKQDNNSTHQHNLAMVAAKDATCIDYGNIEYYTCSGCDMWFSDERGEVEITNKSSVKIARVEHNMTFVEGNDATCTTDGNTEYFTCSMCKNWFADGKGETQIADKESVVIEKNHKLTHVAEVEATCTTNGNITYYTCSACEKWFTDNYGSNEITDRASIVVPAEHKIVFFPKNEASCTTDGYLKHYACERCEKWFEDKNGKNEITDKSGVIIAHQGHSLTLVEARTVTCSIDGNIAYYTCAKCDGFFEDENGETEISDKSSVMIVHSGHDYVNKICTVCRIHVPTSGISYKEYYDYSTVFGIGTATDTDIYIADAYNGKPVTAVETFAFGNCENLKSVTIPDGVTTIGNSAFYNCINIKSVSLPDSVTVINDYAFYNCSSLTSIEIPDKVTVIGSGAFNNCSSLENVNLSDSLTSIEYSVFGGCSSLKNINIPASVTSIGNSAFNGCTHLESIIFNGRLNATGNFVFKDCGSLTGIEIPDGVTSINERTFENCSNLKSVTIPDSVTSIGVSAFKDCNSLVNVYYTGDIVSWCALKGLVDLMNYGGSKTLYIGGKEISGELIIPDGVTIIENCAFANCSVLTSVKIPDSLSSIGYGVFENCSNIESAIIPAMAVSNLPILSLKTVKITSGDTLDENAFYGCSGLVSVEMPESLTCIGDYAFHGCSGLTSIEIPDSVTTIGAGAFYDCSKITIINIPDGVTEIANSVFNGCMNLASIELPDGVKTIGVNAFYGCNNLASITLPESLISIRDYAFSDGPAEIKYSGDIKSWCAIEGLFTLMYSNAANRKLFIDGVEIKDDLIISKGVTYIGDYAFRGCSGLTSIEIPDSVTTIGAGAFYDCSKITIINIPDGVTEIGEAAFCGCDGLKIIKIPDGIKSIADSAFAECGNIEAVTLPMTALSKIHRSYLKTVVLTSGDSIIDKAFGGCVNLSSINIPDSVISIGNQAFSGCRGLTSINIPVNMTTIGSYAFLNCDNLTDIYFDGDISSWCSISGLEYLMNNGVIDKTLYINGKEVTSLVIPDGVTFVSDGAFSNCSGLTSVTIPNSVTSIGNGAFYNCHNIESAKIPALAIPSIPLYRLKTAVITNGNAIENRAFMFFSSLVRVEIPDSVVSIGEYAFNNCSSLTDIMFKGTKEQWEAIEKGEDWNLNTGNYTVHCNNGDITKT